VIENNSGAIKGHVRLSGFDRLAHGLHLPEIRNEAATAHTLRQLDAWTLVLPPGAGYTHITAAWLRGWWMPRLPEHVPVFASGAGSEHPRRSGLVYSRVESLAAPTMVSGLPIVSPEESLLRAARDLSLFDLTIMAVSARRSGVLDAAALAALCASHRPGVRALRIALSLADERYESPFEVLLALFHELAGVPVEPQHGIFDDEGRFVARGDLWLVGTNSIHEYDGAVHGEARQRALDLRRDRRLLGTSYVRRGYSADDLFNHPLVMLQEIDAAVGRRHDPRRIGPWRRHLAESTYSTAGRRRLQNRWLRLSEHLDWTQTA
jgi:hypothetical protein